MDWSIIAGFWLLSLLLALTPGADWAYAISSGIKKGGTVSAVLGMLSGHSIAVLAVSVGIASVLSSSPTAMGLLTILGACYLAYLGISALRHPPVPEFNGEDAFPAGQLRLFAKGVGISLLNPKVVLLFLAMLPQFVRTESAWPPGIQMATLGLLHVLNCAAVYFAVGFGAGIVLSKRPRTAKVVGRLSGVVMIGLGAGLIVEQIIS